MDLVSRGGSRAGLHIPLECLSLWTTRQSTDDFEEFAAKNKVTCSGEFGRGGAMRRVNRRSQEYIHFPWIEGTEIATDSVGCPRCAQDSKITIMHLRFGSQNAASCMQQRIACSFQDTRLNIPHMRSCTTMSLSNTRKQDVSLTSQSFSTGSD